MPWCQFSENGLTYREYSVYVCLSTLQLFSIVEHQTKTIDPKVYMYAHFFCLCIFLLCNGIVVALRMYLNLHKHWKNRGLNVFLVVSDESLFLQLLKYFEMNFSSHIWILKTMLLKKTKKRRHNILYLIGGFHLVDLIITELKSHMTC